MKPDQYNPKAREAFARSLIDIGVAMFKGIMLLVTVAPLTLIIKSVFDGGDKQISIVSAVESMSVLTQIAVIIFLIASFLFGHFLRKEGLRHLHEIEKGRDGR